MDDLLPKYDEVNKIEKKYKSGINIREFIMDLYKNNNYNKIVNISFYEKQCKNTGITDAEEFLKYLILKGNVREVNDKTSINNYGAFDDEYMEEYFHTIKSKKEFYLKINELDISNYIFEKFYQAKENIKDIEDKNGEMLKKTDELSKNYLVIMGLFVSLMAILTTNIDAIKGNLPNDVVIVRNISLILGIAFIFLFICLIFWRTKDDLKKIGFILFIIVALFLGLRYFNKDNEDNSKDNSNDVVVCINRNRNSEK